MPSDTPPVLAAYQSIIPALVVAESTTLPAPQRLFELLEVSVGIVFMVAIIGVLKAE